MHVFLMMATIIQEKVTPKKYRQRLRMKQIYGEDFVKIF